MLVSMEIDTKPTTIESSKKLAEYADKFFKFDKECVSPKVNAISVGKYGVK